jgi:hypothetical protein
MFADPADVVPAGGGTITSFSVQSETVFDPGTQLDFVILRAYGSGNYTIVGYSGPVTLAGNGTVETFPASIPTQAGDIIGFVNLVTAGYGADDCLQAGSGSIVRGSYRGLPGVGSYVPLTAAFPGSDINESATLTTKGAPASPEGGATGASP